MSYIEFLSRMIDSLYNEQFQSLSRDSYHENRSSGVLTTIFSNICVFIISHFSFLSCLIYSSLQSMLRMIRSAISCNRTNRYLFSVISRFKSVSERVSCLSSFITCKNLCDIIELSLPSSAHAFHKLANYSYASTYPDRVLLSS